MKICCFNNGWQFKKNEKKEWECINLPHDAMLFECRSADAPSGSAGGYFYGGKYVYKKTFSPELFYGRNLILYFEGVYGECAVFVNGKQVAKNVYGYNDFYADISDAVSFGKENEITVEVDNSKIPNSRWYSGSGIYRPVWLYYGGDMRIARNGLKISTPDVAEDVSRVDIQLDIENDRREITKTEIQTEILNADGNTVYKEITPFTVFEKGESVARQRLYLQNVNLWSTEKPYLYTCKVKLLSQSGEVLDESQSDFGIRKITVDPIHGLRINGKKVLLRGACIHHDNGVIGAAEYYDACERRIRILKEAGFNAVRVSHHPSSEALLKACDSLGMLVWDETFDMWQESKNKYDFSLYFDEEWRKVVDNMVDKDFNHPCVFIYAIGNEIPEIIKTEGIKISRMISERIRERDNTRLVTNAINGLCAASGKIVPLLIDLGIVTKEQVASITGNPDSDSTSVFNVILQAAAGGGDINDAMLALANNMGRVVEHPSVAEKLAEPLSHLDVSGYNYMKARYDVDASECPNKIIVGSETTPPDIDILWEKVKRIPQLLGDFTWTGWDYIGETGVGHTNYEGKSEFSVAYPGYLAYCGDIDITGYRRPMSYLREIVFGLRKKPYISVQNPKYYGTPAKTTAWAEPETVESWTWSGYEGKPIKVVVYSCDEEIALFVNGRETERKKVERNRAVFETIYERGEISASGYNGGILSESYSVKTADDKMRLDIRISKTEMKAKDEISFLEMQIIDANGITVMDADSPVKVTISENAEIIGFGTGNPNSCGNFFDDTHTTFNGRALAIVRGIKSGIATVKIEWNNSVQYKELKII